MDFVEAHPIPERLTRPIRDVLAGRAAAWPGALSADEVRTLVAHGVAPLLYSRTHDPALRDEAIRAAALEPARTDDLRRVLAVLRGAGVEALLTKGAALAWQVYDAPELRPRGDTDLLVAPAAAAAARRALLEAGLSESPSSGDEHGVRQSLFTSRGAGGIDWLYDLHWEVTNTPLTAGAIPFERAVAGAVPVEPLGADARALGPADALLLACVHRVAHHHDSGKLIWLVDIALLRDRMTPEEHARFWRAAAAARAVGICRRSIALADEWTSRLPADGAEGYLTPEETDRPEPSRVLLDRELSYGALIAADLRALPWRRRIARVRDLAFPPASFMRAGGSGAPLAWLYLRRGMRSLRRLFRRARST